MNYPARGSKLDPYGEEILALHRQGRKLSDISRHLATTYGLTVAISTLSEFVNRDRPATPPVAEATPAQQTLLDQVEVYAEIQASLRVLVEEVQAMRGQLPSLAGLEARLEEFARQLGSLRLAAATPAGAAGLPAELRPLLPRLEAFLANQERATKVAGYPVPYVLIRRIWGRAFWTVTGLWGSFFAVWTYWLGFWQVPQPFVDYVSRLFTQVMGGAP